MNEDCRGDHGDDPATLKACDRRTVVNDEPRAQGCSYRMGDCWTCGRIADTRVPALRGQPNIVAPAGNGSVWQPFVVKIETSVSEGARPIVTGTTNLPDRTHLSIWIKRPWLPNAKERLAVGLKRRLSLRIPCGRSVSRPCARPPRCSHQQRRWLRAPAS